MKKKRKLKTKKIVSFLFIIFAITISIVAMTKLKNQKFSSSKDVYIASQIPKVKLYNLDFTDAGEIIRGSKVELYDKKVINETTSLEYNKIIYQNSEYLIELNMTQDNLENAALEKVMYIRTPVTVYKELNSSKILGALKKGESVEVLGYDYLNDQGYVNKYKIKYNDLEGYIYGKYVVTNENDALVNYDQDGNYQIHAKRTNVLGGGNAGNLDYFPVTKPQFENNIIPDELRTLYLNSGVLGNVDAYINFAKESNINGFVVDIKDNTSPAYESKVMEQMSPTNYKRANNSFERYQNAIKKLKDAGFYVIGRITIFKDSYYITDHPEHAIMDTTTNAPYKHDGSFWPSAYNRSVWEFNVELAKEAVTEMGFNEIQFDYVRFPDRTLSDEKAGIIDFQNTYGEDKVVAIQKFLMYACDEIHSVGAYVSADVFGESAHNYVTGYGQYWSAISNVVDVISGMPYPELFNKYEYGFKNPVWTIPYDLLKFWASNYVVKQQALIPTPAKVRTWIQAYDLTWRVPQTVYDANMVSKQIQGLYDSGLKGGFITWNSASSLSKYQSLKSAFVKEY